METVKTQPMGRARNRSRLSVLLSVLLGVAAMLLFAVRSLTAYGAPSGPQQSQATTGSPPTANANTNANANLNHNPWYNGSRATTILPPTSSPSLISSTIAGGATAGGHYLFWLDQCTRAMAIYGYDLNTNQAFLVKTLPLGSGSLATDGQALVWVEGTEYSGDSIHSYNLSTAQEAIVIPSGTGEYDQIAVDKGTLYYDNPLTGLLARNLSSGDEQLVSADGAYPVAAAGKVLWLKQEQQCSSDGLCISSWKLYMAQQDDLKHSTYLATSGPDRFNGPGISGDKIVWADAWWQDNFTIYDIASNTSTIFHTGGFSIPMIRGSVVVWTEGPGTSRGWSIKSGDITTGASSTIVRGGEGKGFARAWGIAGANNGTVIYSVDDQLFTDGPIR